MDKLMRKCHTLCKHLDQLNTFRPQRLHLMDTRQYMYRMRYNRHQLRKP